VLGARLSVEKITGAASLGFRNILSFAVRSADQRTNYAASTQTYSLLFSREQQGSQQDSQTFGPGEIGNSSSFSTFYSKPRPGEERESFTRGHLGANSEYVAAGIWESVGPPQSSGQESVVARVFRVFIFGSPTVAAEVPKMGTISYNYRGQAYAFSTSEFQGFQIRPADPPELFTINFASGQVTGTIYTQSACPGGLVPCSPLRMAGNLAPDGGRIQGTISDPENRFTGTFEGATFGPGSTEVGFVILLQGPDGRRMVATLVGKSTS
jgi:hypothetical protein